MPCSYESGPGRQCKAAGASMGHSLQLCLYFSALETPALLSLSPYSLPHHYSLHPALSHHMCNLHCSPPSLWSWQRRQERCRGQQHAALQLWMSWAGAPPPLMALPLPLLSCSTWPALCAAGARCVCMRGSPGGSEILRERERERECRGEEGECNASRVVLLQACM